MYQHHFDLSLLTNRIKVPVASALVVMVIVLYADVGANSVTDGLQGGAEVVGVAARALLDDQLVTVVVPIDLPTAATTTPIVTGEGQVGAVMAATGPVAAALRWCFVRRSCLYRYQIVILVQPLILVFFNFIINQGFQRV
jgi:hypothetical protein